MPGAAECLNPQDLMGKMNLIPRVSCKWNKRGYKGKLLIIITACLLYSFCVCLCESVFVCMLPGLWPNTEADLCCKCNSHEARGALTLLPHTHTVSHTCTAVLPPTVSVSRSFSLPQFVKWNLKSSSCLWGGFLGAVLRKYKKIQKSTLWKSEVF